MGFHSIELRAADAGPSAPAPSRSLEVIVLFTDIPSTLDALRFAAQLAQGLTARIRLLLIQSVPYPLPLDRPQCSMSFVEWQFRSLIDGYPVESASRPVATTAEVVLCRDAWQGLQAGLRRDSVIVIGRRGRWWPRIEDRLARRLRAVGHRVVRTSAPQQTAVRGSFHV